MPNTNFLFVILLAMSVVVRPVGAAEPAFISVEVIKKPSENRDVGSVTVSFIDWAGRAITEAVDRQGYFHWILKQNGVALDATSPLTAGPYEFVLNYGGRFLRRPVEIKANRTTSINIRPGVVHMTSGPFGKKPNKIQLILTRAPELTAAQFRRDGCRRVTPNIALISEFQADAAPMTLYLPPGLYRVITQYDRRLKRGDGFLKISGTRPQAARLGNDGLRVDPPVKPPIYHGKCYY